MKSFILFFTKLTAGKTILLALISIIAVLLDTKIAFLGLTIIIVLDLFTGVRKGLHIKGLSKSVFKKHFWKSLVSSGMRDTWRKTYEYGIGIVIAATIQTMIIVDSYFTIGNIQMTLAEIAIAVAASIEVWSIYENLEAISGRNPLKKIFNLRKSIIGK